MDIVDSDAFLDMPQSSQLLYFHLGMRADDDGFIGNPKSIQRSLGSSDDDLKLLFHKRFILAFPNGVIVVKHWRINNTIRTDRYTETRHIAEKLALGIEENGAYTEAQKINGNSILPIARSARPEWQKRRDKAIKNSELPYSFSYKIKQAFWGKQCPLCGIEMQQHELSKNSIPTIQHNLPLSMGGKHELGNISVICHNCNITIQDKETGPLNEAEVAEVWKSIGTHSATQKRIEEKRINIASQDPKTRNAKMQSVRQSLEQRRIVRPQM